MATNFPSSVDNFTNPTSNDSLNSPSHSLQHANANDAIEAIEGYILNTFQPSFRNKAINGDFRIWQRGTSIAAAASVVYGCDRFAFYRADLSTGATISRQTTGLTGFQYGMRLQRDNGNSGTAQIVANQVFESANSIPIAGKNITLSFYARAGANLSSSSSQMTVAIGVGTGTDEAVNTYRFGGWTGQSVAINTTQSITTSWVRYTFSGTIGSSITQLCLVLGFTPTGTASTNDWIEITGVQLEIGEAATPFEQRPIGTELALCQRYYIRTVSNQLSANYGFGLGNSSTQTYFQVQIPEMRTTPTSIDFSNLEASDGNSGAALTSLTINSANSTPRLAFLIGGHSSGITQYRPYLLRNNASTSGYLGLSSEL